MRGRARPRVAFTPAQVPPASSLITLAARINDALVGLGAQPVFALPSPASQPSVSQPSVSQPSVGTVPHHRAGRRPRPRPLHAAPATPVTAPPADDPGSAEPPTDIDETHAATWQLVQQAQGGDGDAFGQLYDRYVDMVFRFIYFRVNDRALAEDFTSETFLRALRRIGSISYQGRDIGAWFVTIARNIVFDHMKSARHRLETPTADTIETSDHRVHSTEAAVLDTLQSEQLMAAVGRLGDEQRECVMLRFIQGLSVNETATVMGKNDGAIKALQHRAIRKLADLVGGELR